MSNFRYSWKTDNSAIVGSTTWPQKNYSRCRKIGTKRVNRKYNTTPLTSEAWFGKILPFWQKLKVFGKFLRVYLVFGKVLSLLWHNFLCYWAFFYSSKSPNVEKNIEPSGHTDADLPRYALSDFRLKSKLGDLFFWHFFNRNISRPNKFATGKFIILVSLSEVLHIFTRLTSINVLIGQESLLTRDKKIQSGRPFSKLLIVEVTESDSNEWSNSRKRAYVAWAFELRPEPIPALDVIIV